jgi:glycosyltransferase involved in cell wall biosynthesis
VPRADVLAAFREWDLFVLPSRRDPFPISMLEAMASGLPVVGTRVDGLAEQIAPGTGSLVPPEDPARLAEAILALCDASPPERRRIGEAARKRVIENFTIEHQVEGMHAAYLAAAGG